MDDELHSEAQLAGDLAYDAAPEGCKASAYHAAYCRVMGKPEDAELLQVGRAYPSQVPYEPNAGMVTPASPDGLALAGAADLRRQCDELRGLVREMLELLGNLEGVEVPFPMALNLSKWVARSREAAK